MRVNSIDRRLKQLEQQRPKERTIIFLRYVDMNRETIPAIGFRFGDQKLFRTEGETDKAFEERVEAAALVKAANSSLSVVSAIITEQ